MEKNVGQRKFDWGVGERIVSGKGYTWHQSGTLEEIVIRAEEKELSENKKCKKEKIKWQDILKNEMEDDDPEDQACLICSL